MSRMRSESAARTPGGSSPSHSSSSSSNVCVPASVCSIGSTPQGYAHGRRQEQGLAAAPAARGARHARPGAYPQREMAEPRAREIPYTIRRSSRARRVRVNVHAHTRRRGRAAGPRARARRRGRRQRAAPVDRAPAGRRRSGCSSGSPRAREPCRTWVRRCELVPQPGRPRVHRDGARLLVPAGDPRPALERFYRRAARAEIAPRLDRATALAGISYSAPGHPRPAHALGVVLGERAHELQLASAAGARARARIRRLARGLPPGDPRPLTALLGAAGAALAGLPRGPRVAAAATARRSCCSG